MKNLTDLSKNMSKPSKELEALYSQLRCDVNSEKQYWVRNDAKLRAVVTAKSYEEFRDIVDAAHLQCLSKEDYSKKAKTNWNKAAM